MTVYGPEITAAFETYASQFDDVVGVRRNPVIDLNSINPLSELREDWQNTTTTPSEHKLSTAADTNEVAYLQTIKKGQYVPGYEAECGMGIRLPSEPARDEEVRWGYYETDDNDEPLNGWYFGVDSDGVFVSEMRNGSETRVYQPDWNVDAADGDGEASDNPSAWDIDVSAGNIFQIEFVYYGYGPVSMQTLTDDGIITLHEFYHDGDTSVENTNLPITAQVDNNSTDADAIDMYVGGRQFSVFGPETTNERRSGHYRESLTGIDDSRWYPVISATIKDGADFGPIDFEHIIASIARFEADTDSSPYQWQLRIGTEPNDPVWEIPSSHADRPDETAVKVDVNSTDIQDANGDATGVFIDGGTLSPDAVNNVDIQQQETSGDIVGGETITLAVRGRSSTTGDEIQEAFLVLEERW